MFMGGDAPAFSLASPCVRRRGSSTCRSCGMTCRATSGDRPPREAAGPAAPKKGLVPWQLRVHPVGVWAAVKKGSSETGSVYTTTVCTTIGDSHLHRGFCNFKPILVYILKPLVFPSITLYTKMLGFTQYLGV